MKDIKDYLHFYIGCPVVFKEKFYQLAGVKMPFKTNNTLFVTLDLRPDGKSFREILSTTDIDLVKPILRPLSDMTEYELQECGNLVYDFSDDDSGLDLNNHRPDDFFLTTSEQFHWLIQRHFDVFGLIESGLAIDKTKLPTNER